MKFKTNLILIIFCISPIIYGQEGLEKKDTLKTANNTKINLNEGTKVWADNMASVVFDKTIAENKKIKEFYIYKQDNNLLVNQEIVLKDNGANNEENLKACETLKKTCRSEKCVAETLIEILGDGDRNVFIKYERKMLSVQIYYTYQDCQ